MIDVPKIDPRDGADIARELFARLHLDRLREDQRRLRADAALIDVFSRFSELVIDRLNRAPEKKFLAFLDFLGMSPLPPQAATVPLTFFLAPQVLGKALVPAGTQVAAAPSSGNQKPVIFETLSDLVVSGIGIRSLLVKNGKDGYANLKDALLPATGPEQTPITVPEKAISPTFAPVPHLFYIALPVSAAGRIDRLTLEFSLQTDAVERAGAQTLAWEIGGIPPSLDAVREPAAVALVPESDTTGQLCASGAIAFSALPEIPLSIIDGQPARWLCCRQLAAVAGPRVLSLEATTEIDRAGLRVEQAFYEGLALDVSKDFLPFGPRPRLGDAFYIACREAFSQKTAVVAMSLQASEADATVPVLNSGHARLCWEFWDGVVWAPLTGEPDGGNGEAAIVDSTLSLLRSGKVEFTFSGAPAEFTFRGLKSYWIRARICAGDYGREAQVAWDAASRQVSMTPATLKPPSLRSVVIGYRDRKVTRPVVVLCDEWKAVTVPPEKPFRPFVPAAATGIATALYALLQPVSPPAAVPAGEPKLSGDSLPAPVNAWVLVDEYAAVASDAASVAPPVWEYRSEGQWKRFQVADETQGFRKSGLIEIIPPGDFNPSEAFGQQGYWLRTCLPPMSVPALRAVILNTTIVVQGITISNDMLGTSSGEPSQRFRSTYPSVLDGQRLEVCEPTLPAETERSVLDPGAIQETTEPAGKTVYWVRWQEVQTFHASGPRDRHYILDHTLGEVYFGDGQNGLIPPILRGNLRMSYRTGGGSAGNQPALGIKQLVNAVPYVQKVVNWVPATGGNDVESVAALMERGPLELRHGGRAVAREDFEDLARKASREVARARCVPQCDVRTDPAGLWRKPGLVSLIVVPRTEDTMPVPSGDLLDRVKSYLDARRLLTADLVVVGPDYARVNVEVEVIVSQPQAANRVEQAVASALKRFLHPLTGGPTSLGWDFGHVPQRSHFYALLEKIPGVSYVGNLNFTIVPERPEAGKARHLLVCSGRHTLSMSL
jgi:hypothetical protein